MWNKYFVFLTGFLLFLDIGKYPCAGDRVDQQFPLGTIGCLFSEDLCGPGESCKDDLLFGICSGSLETEDFAFAFSEQDLEKLEKELFTLQDAELTWRDGYTQCILQNVIVSLTIREPFSKKICFDLLEYQDPVTDGIKDTLSGLLSRTLEFDQATPRLEGFPLIPNSQKRDEIIKVHKYFDKSKSIHKRNRLGADYLSYYPKDDILEYYPQGYGNFQSQNDAGWDDAGVSLDDLKLLAAILESEGQETWRQPSKLSSLLELDGEPQNDEEETFENSLPDGYGIEQDLKPGYLWSDDNKIYNVEGPVTETELPADNEEDSIIQEEPQEEILESLPPHLANKLDQLIKGQVQVKDITDEELEYLTPYVTKMVERLGDMDQGPADLDPLEEVAANAMEMDMMQEPDAGPLAVDEAEMHMNGDLPIEKDADLDSQEVEEVMVKKDSNSAEEEKKVTEKPSDDEQYKFDTNFAYIEMKKPLTVETAQKLIEALQKTVSANPDTLNNYIVEGHQLKIYVDPVLVGLNASEIAEQARDHKAYLEQATGLEFVKSGLGEKAEVEFKGRDDRYFVLTFVLCGCIAGILLAVIVIYLIRRNTRSKQKLQQIAAVQEGNEAASKDYQDLCRQRMQSKSSEKPEPLHAASRVGSVSESQVRSPSSRSSTSSWSEEPVNSNMDISTGHIVLSYMEDHLKNKDRLDREWEAMCSYEADPSSTKVAEDAANARKNRYADVMPYDHSRVVLTTNTNVSGSDYINASTITDHDPRNPAYIATQGPLPHTVADFWQMVWEQGSVVIVMLTKLKDAGEDKCHRYWPEEGSDLYHIYEVHLVSEHIWCDDYIVRSFYLKNLQTSETRTVTQFHFLTWPDLGIPSSIKALLDFRRKTNKSYRGRSCPIVVHCSDGCGRTGTYCLIDMVLNRMAKGAKEIDIAATLEHIRDQRMNMVKTKEQFQFALAAVAEEVHAILKALPQ